MASTPETVQKVHNAIELIGQGKLIKQACAEVNISITAFREAVLSVRELASDYARAQEFRADMWADEIIEISDTAEDQMKARNQIDARRWLASKHNQRRYGDRVELNVQQSISISDALTEARARLLRPVSDQPPVIDAQVVDIPRLNGPEPTDTVSDSAPEPLVPDIFS